MISTIKKWVSEHKAFTNYFLISCFVTVIDVLVSLGVEKGLVHLNLTDISFAPLIGNVFGVVTGFIVQYFLCMKAVYSLSNIKTFVVFFVTWLIGLGVAEIIIYVVRTLIFNDAEGLIYFAVGKGFSIVIPFFLTYFLRAIFIPSKKD